MFKNRFILLFLLAFLGHCAKTDPVTGEKVLIETDTRKKSREFVDRQGGFFGEIGKSNSGTNFEFSTSNVLWRATLKSLDFLPLVNADYSGGILIYDWYSNKNDKYFELYSILHDKVTKGVYLKNATTYNYYY